MKTITTIGASTVLALAIAALWTWAAERARSTARIDAIVKAIAPQLKDSADDKKCRDWGSEPGQKTYVDCRATLEAGRRGKP
jgi:hypothetical protein